MPKRRSINHHMVCRASNKYSIDKLGHLNRQQRQFVSVVTDSFMMIKKRMNNRRDILWCKDVKMRYCLISATVKLTDECMNLVPGLLSGLIKTAKEVGFCSFMVAKRAASGWK
ncbi:hypothetical protein HanPSC8_Chr02g0054591 [Helianthus annuus]|nr:hypothetical protein HanPSC8_Chr02g0054591 [Helianthus annuus]